MAARSTRSSESRASVRSTARALVLAKIPLGQKVKTGITKLTLTSMEQAVLYLLASNAGEVMTREFILDTLWASDYLAESNVVDRHVRNLRSKLKDDWKKPRYIATVPGRGYRFIAA